VTRPGPQLHGISAICQTIRDNSDVTATFQRCIDCVDIARGSSARGRQTTVRWQKQVFIHTRLLRAYLALARLSCQQKRCQTDWTKRPPECSLIDQDWVEKPP